MTALDVSPWVTETDESTELKEYKDKVREEAQKAKQEYSWCQKGVDKILSRIGIEPEPLIVVAATTALGLDVKVNVAPSLLAGKTEAQQKAVVAKAVGKLNFTTADRYSDNRVAGVFTMSGDAIATMEIKTRKPGEKLPEDQRWKYLSPEGRVMHALTDQSIEGLENNERIYVTALCGQGNYSYEMPQRKRDAKRGENRHCGNCEKALAKQA